MERIPYETPVSDDTGVPGSACYVFLARGPAFPQWEKIEIKIAARRDALDPETGEPNQEKLYVRHTQFSGTVGDPKLVITVASKIRGFGETLTPIVASSGISELRLLKRAMDANAITKLDFEFAERSERKP